MQASRDDSVWDLYWEMRLQALENLGKRAAIVAASALVRRLAEAGGPVALLELGCGEAQVLGALADAHGGINGMRASVGVDYNPRSLARARLDYPGLRFIEGDFTDPALLNGLGKFQVVLLVNALHEVFSATFSEDKGEVDVPLARQRVEQALALASGCLSPGGWLVLFDGLEPPGDLCEPVRIRFLDAQARASFTRFAREYRPFRITYRELSEPLCIELPHRDFTRYIDKSIFLEKNLWETERLESYQYFTEDDFRAAFACQGLNISELRTLTENEEKWRQCVEILTPGVVFPQEHILILAQAGTGGG